MTTKRPTTRASRSRVGRSVLALAVASLITALSAGAALADDHHDRGRHRGWERRHSHHYYGRYDPVYPPPPFVYTPAPAPGISLFFPFR